ncbi:MAG: phospholipase D-like domain-containing protein [Candidatus Bipolaricaulota bacterium]|nr:phospholipase D-like domain-containing protein [Candidatus Bipolaricaulota bacterium]
MRDPGKARGAGTIGVFATLVLCFAVRADTTVWPLVDVAGTGGYVAAVADALAGARETVDVLLSSIDLEGNPLVDGLVQASGRGVRVRVLVDQSDWEETITVRNRPAVDALQAEGIDARFDDPEITTHAKLVIVDDACVVVGSTNWNRYALYEHRQAGVRIDDVRTAQAFAAFFERQWTSSGERVEMVLDGPIPVDGAPTIVAIPDDDGTSLYGTVALELLARAQRSVDAVLYRVSVYPQYADSVTSELVAALVGAAARGVDVRVVIDDCRFYEDSAAANLMSAIYLYQSGVDVRFDDPDVTTHAKLLVIDGESVLLGSTNWNYYSVERNVEANVALLFMPDVALVYEPHGPVTRNTLIASGSSSAALCALRGGIGVPRELLRTIALRTLCHGVFAALHAGQVHSISPENRLNRVGTREPPHVGHGKTVTVTGIPASPTSVVPSGIVSCTGSVIRRAISDGMPTMRTSPTVSMRIPLRPIVSKRISKAANNPTITATTVNRVVRSVIGPSLRESSGAIRHRTLLGGAGASVDAGRRRKRVRWAQRQAHGAASARSAECRTQARTGRKPVRRAPGADTDGTRSTSTCASAYQGPRAGGLWRVVGGRGREDTVLGFGSCVRATCRGQSGVFSLKRRCDFDYRSRLGGIE